MVNGAVTASEPITVSGEVNLILADGCTLNAQKGIVVTTGNSLTIYAQSAGSGSLTATGEMKTQYDVAAGIGGGVRPPTAAQSQFTAAIYAQLAAVEDVGIVVQQALAAPPILMRMAATVAQSQFMGAPSPQAAEKGMQPVRESAVEQAKRAAQAAI